MTQQLTPPRYGPASGYRGGTPYAAASAPSARFGQTAGRPDQRQFGQGAFRTGVPQYGPAPVMPGPRPRNPLRLVLVVLIVVAVGALAGLAITGLASQPATVQYQNDDYQVPPPDTNPPDLPLPTDYAQAEDWITKSKFYDQTAPVPVRCNSQPINVATASDDLLKSHFEGLMECLVRVWEPPVTGAGFQIVRPTVTIYGDSMTTKCGTSGVNAFYCAADQQVYYSRLLADALPTVKQNKWTADVVMAHEFGHAVQARTGILISALALGQHSGDKAVALQYSRRVETQADCLSGMFIRAVSTSLGVQQQDVDGIIGVYVAVGDDTLTKNPNVVGNHGLARSRQYWGTTGLRTSKVADCNTFVAAPSLVR